MSPKYLSFKALIQSQGRKKGEEKEKGVTGMYINQVALQRASLLIAL